MRVARSDWSLSQIDYERWSAFLHHCPGCHKALPISNHTIKPDGRVVPSVICGLCRHHIDEVLLDGWAEAITTPIPSAPPQSECNKCGRKTLPPHNALSGWAIAGPGLICPKCLSDLLAPASGREEK